MRIERVVLEHEGEITLGGLAVLRLLALDLDRTAADALKAGDHPQQGGLATPGRPEQDDELPIGDIEADAVDRGEVPESPRDVLQSDLGNGWGLRCHRGRERHRGDVSGGRHGHPFTEPATRPLTT